MAQHPNIDGIIHEIEKDAVERKRNAGLDGSWSDHGASDLMHDIMIYKHGMRGTIPPEWEQYAHKLDPEYAEYERLKQKFGGR